MPRGSLADEFDVRDVIRELSAAPQGRLGFHDLADRCAIPQRRRPHFRRYLKLLLREGTVRAAKGRRYRLGRQRRPQRELSVEGVVRRHRNGFGFLSIPEEEEDLFLGHREMENLLDGDIVRAVPRPGRFGRMAGRVVEIVSRSRTSVTGVFHKSGAREWVDPDPELFGEPLELVPGAVSPRDGEVVEVEITDYPDDRRPAVGRIVEILGAPGELGTYVETVIRRHDPRRRFPADVLEEAESLPAAPDEASIDGRTDLRREPTFTIDGEDARDFDDAVSIHPLEDGGMRLQVSIADVSEYVQPGSPLDDEAQERATSIYFPDRVIPMLPERLSNGIASLRPGEDRLTLTCEMVFDREGNRTGARLYESVIRSWGRWTYRDVARAMDGEEVDGISEHHELLVLMGDLAGKLRERRAARGSLDFDLPEPHLILDAAGTPQDVLRAERHDSHRLIEEFMIAANEAVAEWLESRKAPGLFRVHAPPDPGKLREFVEFARHYGHVPDFGALASSQALAAFLESVRGSPAERALHHLLLRTMMRAEYSAENRGHFGLASESYLHFTSPIRRYPDLVVHRIVKAALRRKPISRSGLPRLAAHASEREAKAAACERDVVSVMRAWLLSDRLDEEFDGIVSGVIEEGFFVELFDIYVEGMVRVEDLGDDRFRFLPDLRALVGQRSKRRFAIGDPVRVRVQAVHVGIGKVEFAWVRGGRRASRG